MKIWTMIRFPKFVSWSSVNENIAQNLPSKSHKGLDLMQTFQSWHDSSNATKALKIC